jgi:hypothetical protein
MFIYFLFILGGDFLLGRKVKCFFAVLLISAYLPFSYMNTKAYADDVTMEAMELATTGSFVQPELAPVLFGAAALGCIGITLYNNYADDIKKYLYTQAVAYGTSKLFDIYSQNGSDYVGYTDEGKTWLENEASNIQNSSSVTHQIANDTTDVTSYPSTPQPYMNGNYYMVPYSLDNYGVATSFAVSPNDSLNWWVQVSSGSSNHSIYSNGGAVEYFRLDVELSSSGSHMFYFQRSSDNSKWF